MKRNLILVVACCLALSFRLNLTTGNAQRQPAANRKSNVIFILGDDLGVCDISMYGCKDIPTPNIDSIAAKGVKFTNGYVSAPVCSPSRAGLMTGCYQHRFGFEFNAGPLQRAVNDKEMDQLAVDFTRAGGGTNVRSAPPACQRLHAAGRPAVEAARRICSFAAFAHGSARA